MPERSHVLYHLDNLSSSTFGTLKKLFNHLIFFVLFCLLFAATSGDAQDLFLDLCSEITFGSAGGG